MSQSLADIQQEIDVLFTKLDNAQEKRDVAQANHALRIKVSRKRQMGGRLTEREQTLLAATGGDIEVRPIKTGGGLPVVPLIVVAVLAGAAYIAYKTFVK